MTLAQEMKRGSKGLKKDTHKAFCPLLPFKKMPLGWDGDTNNLFLHIINPFYSVSHSFLLPINIHKTHEIRKRAPLYRAQAAKCVQYRMYWLRPNVSAHLLQKGIGSRK